jgi:hypothetical protein
MGRAIVAVTADKHSGHKLGLQNPETKLYDETPEGDLVAYVPEQTATQGYLWANHLRDIDNLRKLAHRDRIILVDMGDPCHGDKYPSQLVSTRMADQVLLAVGTFVPWLKVPNLRAVRIIQGTGAHGFGEASAEILITAQLKTLAEALLGRRKRPSIKTLRHGLLTVEGVTIDYAHHGPGTGKRMWTRGNSARFYARDIMIRELARGRTPPRVVLRAHFHEYVRETVRLDGHVTDFIVCPPLCGMSEYSQQASRSQHEIHDGILALEVERGELVKVHDDACRVQDLRTKEEL